MEEEQDNESKEQTYNYEHFRTDRDMYFEV